MDDKEPNNIRVQCLYRSKADYIHCLCERFG